MLTRLEALWRELGSFLLRRSTERFGVLRLPERRRVSSDVPISIDCYSNEAGCPENDLLSVKGMNPDRNRRWSRRRVCYLARVRGTPVAYLWLAFDGWRAVDKEQAHSLPVSAAFLYDAVTVSDWRENNIYPALILEAASDLAGQGYKEVYLLADDRNLPALRPPPESRIRVHERDCSNVPGSEDAGDASFTWVGLNDPFGHE